MYGNYRPESAIGHLSFRPGARDPRQRGTCHHVAIARHEARATLSEAHAEELVLWDQAMFKLRTFAEPSRNADLGDSSRPVGASEAVAAGNRAHLKPGRNRFTRRC